ncbi:MAG: hypothetical protein COB53_09040 [Elusimicrobia bacterium]|nr:MAG: hypothetical protein COB53_09040 [Elusimicrobiota bacterium]
MRSLLAFALLVSGTPAMAGGAMEQATNHPNLKAGLIHLYNLDYDKTQESALSFRRQYPANPFGHLFLAGAAWWRYTTESEQLRPDTDFLDRFDDYVDATVDAAKPLIRSKDKVAKTDGLFTAGMVLGLRGQMKLTNGKFFGAYRDGKKAMKYLRKCVKINPQYDDALMGLGIFDYQVAVLPGILKFGAKLLFRGTGNAARGIRRIRSSISKGRFANNQAAAFLLTIFMVNEHDYTQAYDVVNDLHIKFPESPYYGFMHAALLHRSETPAESRTAMRAIFDRHQAEPHLLASKQLGTICGQFGPDCLDRNYLQAADAWLNESLPLEKDPSEYKALLTLYRGVVRDLLGKRREAIADYNALVKLPEIVSSRAWGKRCSVKACKKKDAIRLLRGERP